VELGLVRSLLIDQSTFDNCSATSGGALHLNQWDDSPSFAQQTLLITNSHFVNNRATLNGGSVAVEGLPVDIRFVSCTFLNSTSAEGWGGSVSVRGTEKQKTQVFFSDCVFRHSAAVRGGAIYAEFAQLFLARTKFSHTYGELDTAHDWHSARAGTM